MFNKKLLLILLLVIGIPLTAAGGIIVAHLRGYIETGDNLVSRAVEAAIVRPRDNFLYTERPDKYSGYSHVKERQAVPCFQPDSRSAVLFAFGQSNASNRGPVKRRGKPGFLNFNIFDGKCYPALDPLLGSDGEGGNVWTALGNQLITTGAVKKLIIVSISVLSSIII